MSDLLLRIPKLRRLELIVSIHALIYAIISYFNPCTKAVPKYSLFKNPIRKTRSRLNIVHDKIQSCSTVSLGLYDLLKHFYHLMPEERNGDDQPILNTTLHA